MGVGQIVNVSVFLLLLSINTFTAFTHFGWLIFILNLLGLIVRYVLIQSWIGKHLIVFLNVTAELALLLVRSLESYYFLLHWG